jgi:hypothetical protein
MGRTRSPPGFRAIRDAVLGRTETPVLATPVQPDDVLRSGVFPYSARRS